MVIERDGIDVLLWVKHYNHSPVIISFKGGINLPFPGHWVVNMTLFDPHVFFGAELQLWPFIPVISTKESPHL